MTARRQHRRRTLRRRVLAATLAISTLATIAFGIPLGIALTRMERERVVLRLERQASEVLAYVPDEQLNTPRALSLPEPIAHDTAGYPTVVGVYDAAGHRLSGNGPATSPLAAHAARAAYGQSGSEVGQLTVAEPLRSDRPGTDALRVAVDESAVAEEQRETVALMSGLAVLVIALASVVAFVLARRLARPLEALAGNARRLGGGDFTVRTTASSTTEIDEVGQALDVTADRLGEMLDRERAFTADASHQMRTPLTALRLGLETAPYEPDATVATVSAAALGEVERLEATVAHLLAIARDVGPPSDEVDLNRLAADLEARWEPVLRRSHRTLVVDVGDELPPVRASSTGLSHVLDVLVDNAAQHGAGTVTVRGRKTRGAVALDVSDEGPGVTGDPATVFRRRSDGAAGHGIGLALARSLVEADGGRLELSRVGPGPTFTVVLPVAAERPEPAAPAESSEFR